MSYSPMDLDSSLDDLIKKRRTPRSSNKNNKSHSNNNNKRNNQAQSRPAIQTNKAKITKNTPQRSNINSRLSTAPATPIGPLFTAKNKQQQPVKSQNQTDPSKIIITKTIANSRSGPQRNLDTRNNTITSRLGTPSSGITSRLNKPPIPSALANRLGTPQVKSVISGRLGGKETSFVNQERVVRERQPLRMESVYEDRPFQGFTIRGISNTIETQAPISIKGGAGPTTILITGLDRGSNSQDVQVYLEQFGNILHCEVLRNKVGQSLGEAEVEFSTKSAALDCIAVLDNREVDGERVRVILREPKPTQTFQKQVRSVISTTSSGKLYSDQMTSRYDIRR